MLSLMVLASSIAISYMEPFHVGDDLDLNQGYYVCDNDKDNILPSLARIPNDTIRRNYAKTLGCRFRIGNLPEVTKIVSHDQDLCLKPEIGYSLEKTGKVPILNCGIEGHRMTVKDAQKTYSVVWLSMDVDYE